MVENRPDLRRLSAALDLLREHHDDLDSEPVLLEALFDVAVDSVGEMIEDAFPGSYPQFAPVITSKKMRALYKLRDDGGDRCGVVDRFIRFMEE